MVWPIKYSYLGSDVIKGFDKYKYSSQDTSPLSRYVMHPFWDWLVNFMPRSVAPNLMTLVGFLCLVVNSLMLIYFDPLLLASSAEHPNVSPVPHPIWIVCALLSFASHTLDGMDGKQARRTGTSSPVGELFDHGLDSWATLFFPMCLYSVFGRGQFGGHPVQVYYLFLCIMGQFVLSHWEKYVTGLFFLPWAYDVSQVGMTGVYIFTFCVGPDYWQSYSFSNWTYASVIILAVYLSFWVMCVPLTAYNVYNALANGTGRQRSFGRAMEPLLSPLILLVASSMWAHLSPNQILFVEQRLFYTAFGTVFSNITCRLIVSQMSNTRCQMVNKLTIMYAAVAVCVLALRPTQQQELGAIAALVALSVALHIHYGANVVNQMLDHFNLRAFVIEDKTKSN